MSERRAWWKTALTGLFMVAAAGGVALALRHQGWEVLAQLRQPRVIPYVLGSLAANLAGLVLGLLSWRRFVVDVGGPVGARDCARIWAVGMFGKYIPGRLWGLVAHVRMGKSAGINAGRMATAFLLSFGVVMLTGAAIGMLAAPGLAMPGVGGSAQWWLAVPVLVLVVALIWPGLANRLVLLMARLARRPAPERLASAAGMRTGIVLALASWLVAGVHLWILTVMLGADPVRALPVGVGGFALATVAGSAALIMPDGWGARELTLTVALATVLPWGEAGVVALASRLVCIVAELGAAAVVLLVTLRRTQPTPEMESVR
ncbi:lysylphosphatidylglycerol synthase domain-containing protein [Actinoplanes sp. TFC3]|uniref:lysylphosphatidylglycerol synthase domain-containing protein n=1 Tax=Actinoplanes sp. TFC3 TaxID=1710355 RepID=UPI0008372990|nr:lysylphosphatidylglycerol synthase domain-containing protein [Actinoplanes sp. TFC3]